MQRARAPLWPHTSQRRRPLLEALSAWLIDPGGGRVGGAWRGRPAEIGDRVASQKNATAQDDELEEGVSVGSVRGPAAAEGWIPALGLMRSFRSNFRRDSREAAARPPRSPAPSARLPVWSCFCACLACPSGCVLAIFTSGVGSVGGGHFNYYPREGRVFALPFDRFRGIRSFFLSGASAGSGKSRTSSIKRRSQSSRSSGSFKQVL